MKKIFLMISLLLTVSAFATTEKAIRVKTNYDYHGIKVSTFVSADYRADVDQIINAYSQLNTARALLPMASNEILGDMFIIEKLDVIEYPKRISSHLIRVKMTYKNGLVIHSHCERRGETLGLQCYRVFR